MNYILYFFLYSFFGWCCECIYCSIPQKSFVNRGFLAGPYCPIYGCGALLVLHLLTPFDFNPVLLFIAGMIITSVLEYITSVLMEEIFHTKWWDYSDYPFNINGRVCLKNSFLFGILSIFVYYFVHPHIIHLVDKVPFIFQAVLSVLLSVLFLYDMVDTTRTLLRKNKDFAEIERCILELKADFKEADIFSSDKPLEESIQEVLDSTDADEILLAHIKAIHDMIHQRRIKRLHTHQRLQKAFPNKKEPSARKRILDLFEIMHKHF